MFNKKNVAKNCDQNLQLPQLYGVVLAPFIFVLDFQPEDLLFQFTFTALNPISNCCKQFLSE